VIFKNHESLITVRFPERTKLRKFLPRDTVVQSPSFDVRRGRRVEIKEGAAEQKSSRPNQKT